MNFTEQQLKLIHQAVRFYQINAVVLNGNEYQNCDEILNMTFDNYYTQRKEQST